MHGASAEGHKDVVELLLANKAEVNAKDKNGDTPLHEAAFMDHSDVAALLLANKADINAKGKDGDTPLHVAAAKGHKDVAELLLTKGADVNPKNNNGWTPLSLCAPVTTKTLQNYYNLTQMAGRFWVWRGRVKVKRMWRNCCASTAATNKIKAVVPETP